MTHVDPVTRAAVDATNALVELVDGLQLSIAAHHGPEVQNGYDCDTCAEFVPRLSAAFDQVRAALDNLEIEAHEAGV